ncbi:NAD-dependent succinate-semialdehyde dehydrogenase [Mesorhizobium sp. WSM2239]|uniref:NAD-dependent succinate-semialdehyde dehydrogenase n=2 Tax=unclassified Mesorhizobium TaxID=325217 RepID=A0AAU8DAL1_9HYPH
MPKSSAPMTFTAVNPATDKTVGSYEETSPAAVRHAVEQAHEASLQWRRRDIAERAKLMRAAGRLLRERAHRYGRLMAEEMGKPIKQGVAETQKCADGCDFFADNAARFLAPEIIDIGAAKSFVTFQPLGVILAIMPWNFPFWQVFRFAAPALMAGNAGVMKHSSNVPGCALAIEEVFGEAGFPEHLFRTLLIGSGSVDELIGHPLIRAVTLTGSGPAGRAVARKAGEMLKKTVLELGGSDAYLVLDDADVSFSAKASAEGRLVNSGQSCIAAKRFIVVDSLRSRFEEAFVEEMRAAKMGDPLSEDTAVGPLARHNLRDALHRQVETSLAKGARCLLGGKIPDGPGTFYPPTVLTDVRPGMPAYDEEMFGPVAAIIPVKDEATAINTANDSAFGLGGGIFTRDIDRGERLAVEAIEAGSVFVNRTVQSHPKLPFGGVKESGYGRELSHYGIKEFVNIKTVVVSESGGSPAADRRQAASAKTE